MIVYRGTFETTSGTGTKTVTLDTPVPVGKSYPRITWTAPGTTGSYGRQPAALLTDEVDGHYTKLTFEWLNTSTGSITINWEIITGDELTVQSGREVFTQSKAVAITPVDLDESYIVVSTSSGRNLAYTTYVDAEYTAADEITLTQQHTEDNVLVCWYSVTMAGATVQSGSSTINEEALNATATIDEVDLTKSFLQFSFSTASRPAGRLLLEGHFNSATQIEFKFDISSLAYKPAYIKWFVVTHPKLKVQYGQTTMASGNANPINETIDAIKPDRAFGVISTRNTSTTGDRDGYGKVLLGLSTNYVTLQRLQTVATTTASWFVVEWTAPPAPENLSPVSAIMPDEQNVFSWTLPPGVVQTDYELEYKEVGGEWQPIGLVASSLPQHIFPPSTFGLGKDYEWRVRYRAAGEIDPSDWSAIAEFNTRNPVIQTPTPAPNSSVKVSIRTLGATLKSPYGNDIQLTIEVDDNPEFTSTTTYTLPAVSSGESATVEHAFKVAGYWHVRMTATDTAANQTILTYTIFAGQFIQFLAPPDVQLQAPQATHVTVRVRGTTTEYTAVREPVSPPEKMVERLVYIDSGTQATCQAVAQELIAKWGREQVSVKGVIPLTLVLKPDQKVRVVIPEIGLNGELILQKKFHDVIPRSETHVELGDIMLSEQELIARIIDDLEGQSAYVSTLGSEMVLLGQELSEREIADIEQCQQLSDTDITVIEMGGDDAID